MSNSFVFSKILPLNSIVNPNTVSSEYLDSQSPFSFFDYIKYINSHLSPIQANDLYIEYIKQWGAIKKSTNLQINQSIQDRYIEFAKDVLLKYSTLEEKRFLSNVDFNDELDMDIIIPFLSKKLREICDFYSDKREKLKNKPQKIKNKGTGNSLEQTIYETITDVIFFDVLEVGTQQKIIDETLLLSDLKIEIEELYDLYTNYLDNDPVESYETYDVKTDLRKLLYSSNINDINANIFINFEQSIVDEIMKNVRTFLTEFGRVFTVNYNLASVDLNCKPDDKLYDLISANKTKAERIVSLKNKLIKKYIGSDFYYITTGSTITDVTSSILFKADNPSGNLLNRHFPTTASVEEESDLQSCRRIGLFFTPEKNSILYYSVPEKKYKIDSSKLEPNKLYIFPDPAIYGNTSGLTRKFDYEYPLIHIAEYTKSVKNKSTGNTEGDINSNPYTQDYYPYFSRNQLSNNFNLGNDGFLTNFSNIYNNGVITKWTTDIYGNQYALFKQKSRKQLIDNTIVDNISIDICEEYEGGPIEFFGGDLLPEEAQLNDPEWVKPDVWASDYYYNLSIDGEVGDFKNGTSENEAYQNVLSSIKHKDFDGGLITDVCDAEFDFNSQTKFIINETLSTNKTITSSITDNNILNSYELRSSYGSLYIRDIITGAISPLSSALAVQISNKYQDDFFQILDFNIYNDFIWIRTKNNIIFEKLLYNSGMFEYSGTEASFIKTGIETGFLRNVSNPFIFENRDYCMVAELSVYDHESNDFSIIPSFYKIDYSSGIKTKISIVLVSESYHNNVKDNPIKITKINEPTLIYNSRNDTYSVITTVEDQNEFAYIYQIWFSYNGKEINPYKIIFHKYYGNETYKTINFYDSPSLLDNNIILNDITSNTTNQFADGALSFS